MGPMKCPQGLGPDGRRAWRRALATMDAVATDADLYEEQLERLAFLRDDLALARRRWVARKRPLTEAGSTGQHVPHSLLRVQSDLRKEISGLESELGLTLASQRKLGRAVRGGRPAGAASAPDRRQAPARRGKVTPLFPLGDDIEAALGTDS
jgi:P27 family predicted phage terminase small subunit